MKPLNDNLTIQRLSGWVIDEVQKSLGLAATTRLKVDTDNADFWLRNGGVMKVVPGGARADIRTHVPIEITFDWEREVALFWCDDITSLVRPNRLMDFDRHDLPDAPVRDIGLEVTLNEGLERLPIWESLPANPQDDNRRPVRVVGMA